MTEIRTIAVIGSGQMGTGIAQVCARAGFDVILNDLDAQRVQAAVDTISRWLLHSVEKGKLSERERREILSRIASSTDLNDLSDTDLAIEAISEDKLLKQQLFRELDRILPQHAIIASNTSSIPISWLGHCTQRPDRVIGLHFMNPVPLMKGVEVIHSDATSAATERAAMQVIDRLGKSHVRSEDRAGFIANRILLPMIHEAILALEEGVATREDIDRCMQDCCNFPMGPLALADLIGLDTCKAILETMAEGLHREDLRPPQLLMELVAQGHLGRKTGKGFYDS